MGGVRFNHTAEELPLITEAILSHGNGIIYKIMDVPEGERTFLNTMIPFAQMESDFDAVEGAIDIYTTLENESLQVAAEKVSKDLAEFDRTLYQNKALYDVFEAWKS